MSGGTYPSSATAEPMPHSAPFPDTARLTDLPAKTWIALGAFPVISGHEAVYLIADPEIGPALSRALETENVKIRRAPAEQIEALQHQYLGPALARSAETDLPLAQSSRDFARPFSRDRLRMPFMTLGTMAFVMAAPSQAAVALTFWCILTLILVTLLKVCCVTATVIGRKYDAPLQSVEPNNMPHISIMIPLHMESRVVPRLIRRMQRLNYPVHRREFLFVVEEDDTLTRSAFEAAAPLPEGFRVICVPDGQPKTKPRALNYALNFCRGSIVGVYDAEDAPERNQLEKVAAGFSTAPPDVVCLQGRLDYYNPRENWLARCFTTEYASWFRLILPGLSYLRLPVPLGGTTLFVRRTALEELGAWDAHNVTEDADLGIRLARRGWRTALLPTTTHEEANCRTWPWIKQRSRWIKGYMITYLVHMRNPWRLLRELGLRQFIGFQVFFGASISQFFLAPFLWSFWLIPLGFDHPVTQVLGDTGSLMLTVLFLFCEAISLMTSLASVSAPHMRHLLPWTLSMPFYFPLATPAAYKATYELILKPFYWDKTTHGVSKEDSALD